MTSCEPGCSPEGGLTPGAMPVHVERYPYVPLAVIALTIILTVTTSDRGLTRRSMPLVTVATGSAFSTACANRAVGNGAIGVGKSL